MSAKANEIITRKTDRHTMAAITFQTLGQMLREKRGARGIRETAREIQVSPATLSRMERGLMPDLETFGKVCRWLKLDPAAVLGVEVQRSETSRVSAHFKKDRTQAPTTAKALAQMILDAQRAFQASLSEES